MATEPGTRQHPDWQGRIQQSIQSLLKIGVEPRQMKLNQSRGWAGPEAYELLMHCVKHLRSLTVGAYSWEQGVNFEPLFAALVPANLVSLRIESPESRTCFPQFLQSNSFPNLKVLKMWRFDSQSTLDNIMDTLLKLDAPKLEHLELNPKDIVAHWQVVPTNVFGQKCERLKALIIKFAPTLRLLHFGDHGVRNWGDYFSEMLGIETVRSLLDLLEAVRQFQSETGFLLGNIRFWRFSFIHYIAATCFESNIWEKEDLRMLGKLRLLTAPNAPTSVDECLDEFYSVHELMQATCRIRGALPHRLFRWFKRAVDNVPLETLNIDRISPLDLSSALLSIDLLHFSVRCRKEGVDRDQAEAEAKNSETFKKLISFLEMSPDNILSLAHIGWDAGIPYTAAKLVLEQPDAWLRQHLALNSDRFIQAPWMLLMRNGPALRALLRVEWYDWTRKVSKVPILDTLLMNITNYYDADSHPECLQIIAKKMINNKQKSLRLTSDDNFICLFDSPVSAKALGSICEDWKQLLQPSTISAAVKHPTVAKNMFEFVISYCRANGDSQEKQFARCEELATALWRTGIRACETEEEVRNMVDSVLLNSYPSVPSEIADAARGSPTPDFFPAKVSAPVVRAIILNQPSSPSKSRCTVM